MGRATLRGSPNSKQSVIQVNSNISKTKRKGEITMYLEKINSPADVKKLSTAEMAKIAEQLKYATIVVSSLPLLVMYPFFQKYFDKGIMVGSVKG